MEAEVIFFKSRAVSWKVISNTKTVILEEKCLTE